MDWASRRRFIIASVVVGTLLLLTSTLVFWKTYQPPSCSDGKQNQDETGIDCGGSCPYLCVQENIPPTVLYALPLTTADGRTDVIAMIENKNAQSAARGVSYTLSLYDAAGAVLKEIDGTVDLPPHGQVPVYLPKALTQGTPARAFLQIENTKIAWYAMDSDPRIVPDLEPKPIVLPADKPRLDVSVTNSSLYPLSRVPLVAIIFDTASGNVVTASATIVDVAPQGRSTASFMWNAPFSSSSVRVEVYPVVPLP